MTGQNSKKGTPPQVVLSPDDLTYCTSRSSGPGGQNVNKRETKVDLIFSLTSAVSLTETQKERVREWVKKHHPASYLESDDALRVSAQESRTQLSNKKNAYEKLTTLIQLALAPVKKRKAKKISPLQKEKRLTQKKQKAQRKLLRRKTVAD